MKVGRVATVRIRPEDCMGIVDVLNKVGYIQKGMSFSQAVSWALNAFMNGAREAGTIPVRDGFEYEQMMQAFAPETRNTARKVEIRKEVELRGEEFKVPYPASVEPAPFKMEDYLSKNPKIRRLENRQLEIVAQNKVDPINAPNREEEQMQIALEIARLEKEEQSEQH